MKIILSTNLTGSHNHISTSKQTQLSRTLYTMSKQMILAPQSLKEEIEKLKAENEKLKEFAMNVHNFAYGTTYNDPDIMDSVEDFDDIVNQLKKDEEHFQRPDRSDSSWVRLKDGRECRDNDW